MKYLPRNCFLGLQLFLKLIAHFGVAGVLLVPTKENDALISAKSKKQQ